MVEQQIESITEYLKRRLKEAGASRFDAIADEATILAGLPLDSEDRVHASFIRKFVYGSRENPRVQTIQPLLDYFAAVDRGDKVLPSAAEGASPEPEPIKQKPHADKAVASDGKAKPARAERSSSKPKAITGALPVTEHAKA